MFGLSPKTKKLLSSGLKIIGILLLASVVIWILIINPLLVRQEKKRFNDASASLEQLAKDIQSRIGPANEVTKDESCGRANLKSEKGPLLCTTRYKLRYSNTPVGDATRLMDTVSKSFTGNLRKGNFFGAETINSKHEFTVRENGRSGQIFYQNLDSISGLNCDASYEHEFDKNSPTFLISISCGEPALEEHFSIRD